MVSPARITGSRTNSSQSESFLPVQRPDFLTDLGEVTLDGSSTRTLTPGSYLVRESLMVQNNALLYVDNCAGPVTVYVSGKITVQDTGQIVTCSIDPELFAVYIDGAEPVELKGAGGTFHGVIYAPQSLVEISNDGILYGSLVAGRLDVSNSAVVHYDANLKGSSDAN